MPNRTVSVALILGIIVITTAGADYWFKERPHRQLLAQEEQPIDQPIPTDATGGLSSSQATASEQGQSSSRRAVKKGTSTRKKEPATIAQVLAMFGLTQDQTREVSFIKLTSPPTVQVETVVLLKNSDRAALFAWLESTDAKILFLSLKENLQSTFSSEVKDLVDETRTPDDGAPTDILSFVDPAISSEKIIFARIRTRLYEFHVAPGQEGLVDQLIAELGK